MPVWPTSAPTLAPSSPLLSNQRCLDQSSRAALQYDLQLGVAHSMATWMWMLPAACIDCDLACLGVVAPQHRPPRLWVVMPSHGCLAVLW